MEIDKNILKIMLEKAKNTAINNDCVKDSNFSVAACLLTESGKFYVGHNVENSGIQATCAERTTFVNALSEGEKKFLGILVLSYPKNEKKFMDAWPCGYCREFMSKFVNKDFKVYSIDENENIIGENFSDIKPIGDIVDNKINNLQLNICENDEKQYQKFDDNIEVIIENLKKASLNTNLYYQKEGTILVGYNDKNEKVIYTGSTQTDNSASIIRSQKVALLKALVDGCKKFECAYSIKFDGEKIDVLWPSYDVVQLYLQYASKEFKFYTLNDNKEIFETTVKEALPHAFEF